MTDDTITVVLRVALASSAAVAAMQIPGLFRRSHDTNWIPWASFAIGLSMYSLAVWGLVVGSALTVADWWRPFFSTLIIWVICSSVWLLRRVVRRGW